MGFLRHVAVALLCLSVAGCSTIGDMADSKDGQRIYGGTQRNVLLVEGKDGYTHGGVGGFFFGVFDFPLSLALDTGLLPVTLVVALFRTSSEE